MYEDCVKSKAYKKIRNSLIKELKDSDKYKPFYVDLVEQFMRLWCVCELLNQDIEERGVRCLYDNGGGQTGYKKNDSIDQLNKTNAQMLRILGALKINPEKVEEYEPL